MYLYFFNFFKISGVIYYEIKRYCIQIYFNNIFIFFYPNLFSSEKIDYRNNMRYFVIKLAEYSRLKLNFL
jgi:hypothetical protein